METSIIRSNTRIYRFTTAKDLITVIQTLPKGATPVFYKKNSLLQVTIDRSLQRPFYDYVFSDYCKYEYMGYKEFDKTEQRYFDLFIPNKGFCKSFDPNLNELDRGTLFKCCYNHVIHFPTFTTDLPESCRLCSAYYNPYGPYNKRIKFWGYITKLDLKNSDLVVNKITPKQQALVNKVILLRHKFQSGLDVIIKGRFKSIPIEEAPYPQKTNRIYALYIHAFYILNSEFNPTIEKDKKDIQHYLKEKPSHIQTYMLLDKKQLSSAELATSTRTKFLLNSYGLENDYSHTLYF